MAAISTLVVIILIWTLIITFLVRLIRNAFRKVSIPSMLPQEGFNVPVWNAYLGSIWFNVHNGLYSQLKVFDDHFDGVVVTRKSYPYEMIQTVGVVDRFWSPRTLVITFKDDSWNFNANMNKYNLKEALKFFQSKGYVISESGLQFIELNSKNGG